MLFEPPLDAKRLKQLNTVVVMPCCRPTVCVCVDVRAGEQVHEPGAKLLVPIWGVTGAMGGGRHAPLPRAGGLKMDGG